MYQPIQRTIMTPSERNSLSCSPLRRGFFLIPFAIALAWLALSPAARAVIPAPDGGYPGQNTAEGTNALFNLTTGGLNTAIGFHALFNNRTGSGNTANGSQALFSNITGTINTANGLAALRSNTTGFGNTATGASALTSNTTGVNNTATGASALTSNTTGAQNTANGQGALTSNTTGLLNTANGAYALSDNTTGTVNTADGTSALANNTTGVNNTANSAFALWSNTTGNSNTANGTSALLNNTTGNSNIALGAGAGSSLTTGNNNIAIGNQGVAAESNTIRVGTVGTQLATFIAGIGGSVVPGGVGVIIGIDGRLGTVISSARFKEAINPMDKASETILALKPVTFRYKHALDPEGIPQFGLVAEQVEKVNPDLVARDGQGKVNTVRYEAVNAMLLNEFLKQHRRVQKLEAAIARQQEEIKTLTASVKEQASQIRKVSAQLEVSNATPRMAVNNH